MSDQHSGARSLYSAGLLRRGAVVGRARKERAVGLAVCRAGEVTKSEEYDQYIDWLFD